MPGGISNINKKKGMSRAGLVAEASQMILAPRFSGPEFAGCFTNRQHGSFGIQADFGNFGLFVLFLRFIIHFHYTNQLVMNGTYFI